MRLFVGVDLPTPVKAELGRTIDALRASLPNAKWVPGDNLHLTLAFLGEVAEERVDAITTALGGAVSEMDPFPARLADSGAFPSPRRGRVLWVGLASAGDGLPALAEACIGALEPLGFPRESRRWTAHLTLARLRTPGDLSGVLPIETPAAAFDVTEVTLFRSHLARPAPRYEPLRRVPLGG